MSDGDPAKFKLSQMPAATQQIRAIADIARESGKLRQFTKILSNAMHRLETDPQDWGDPMYHLPSGKGLVCYGIIRPLVFQYVIYEEIRGVILLSVRLFADFR